MRTGSRDAAIFLRLAVGLDAKVTPEWRDGRGTVGFVFDRGWNIGVDAIPIRICSMPCSFVALLGIYVVGVIMIPLRPVPMDALWLVPTVVVIGSAAWCSCRTPHSARA